MRPEPHPADAVGAVFPHEAVGVHSVRPVLPHQARGHLHLPQSSAVPELQEDRRSGDPTADSLGPLWVALHPLPQDDGRVLAEDSSEILNLRLPTGGQGASKHDSRPPMHSLGPLRLLQAECTQNLQAWPIWC